MNLDEMGLTNEERRLVAQRLKAGEAKAPKQCEHVRANGEFCGSPALRGRNYCFFHLTQLGRRLRAERARAVASQLDQPESVLLELPVLEDANSIQIALMQVIDAVLNKRLDAKSGGVVLYGLQTASSNLRRGVTFRAAEGATVAGRYEEFEADYELGDDVPELKTEEPEEAPAAVSSSHEAALASTGDVIEAGTRESTEAFAPIGVPTRPDDAGEVAASSDAPGKLPSSQASSRSGPKGGFYRDIPIPVVEPDDPNGAVEAGTGRPLCSLPTRILCSLIGPAAPPDEAEQTRTIPRAVLSQRVGRRGAAGRAREEEDSTQAAA